jgi:hypothetical protein
MKALAHSAIVASNIVAYLDNKPLKEYKGSSEIIIITNGKVSWRHFFFERTIILIGVYQRVVGVLTSASSGVWYSAIGSPE